jgi:hypothetical protein
MKSIGRYDATLQMFTDQPGEVNMARLQFLRWLAERDLLEHALAGPSVGEYAVPAEPVSGSVTDESGLLVLPQAQ